MLLHVSPHFLVYDKPAGLLSVPGRGEDKQDCAIARVQALYPDALTVHRLDMATSGLLLMARGKTAQKLFSMAFAEGRVHKSYEAVVFGHLPQLPDWQQIDAPLWPDWPNRPKSKVDWDNGKPSSTRWRSLGAGPLPNTSRVALEPLTGRSHQLRLHMLHIGHGIVGDTLYEQANPTGRLMLHAKRLQFLDPCSDQPFEMASESPF
jgi:tRNA pseudouridine32 synthase / 23S rRNA pseudouridine746 synthase